MAGTLDEPIVALLHEVHRAPEDDGPRLVLADLFAERFPAHAELIVAQCTHPTRSKRAAVKRFLATLPRRVTLRGSPTRGFFEPWRFDAAEFARDPDLFFRIAPSDGLLLTDATLSIERLVDQPALDRYRTLDLHQTRLDRYAAEAIGTCAQLSRLHDLRLVDTDLEDDALRALVEDAAFSQLARLDLTNTDTWQHFTVDGFRAVASAPFAGSLEALGLQRAGRGNGDGIAATLSAFPSLRDLDLSTAWVSDAGGVQLFETCSLLQRLVLDTNNLALGAAVALARRHGASLRSLSLKRNMLGTAGVIALATSMPTLEVLALEDTLEAGIDADAVQAIVAGSLANTLHGLGVGNTRIGVAGVAALCRTSFPRLRTLSLQRLDLTDESAVEVAGAPFLPQLQALSLDASGIGDRGARALCTARWEPRHLGLCRNALSTATHDLLARRFGSRVRHCTGDCEHHDGLTGRQLERW